MHDILSHSNAGFFDFAERLNKLFSRSLAKLIVS
jgi:hypothetical protein